MWPVTFLLVTFSVVILYTNLWITFLLSFCYVGNVGYVGYRKKSHAKHTARAIWELYCHYDNENKSSLGLINKIANIANKKLKAAPRLDYRVGVFAQKNSQHHANMGDKLAGKINAKESLAFFYCVAIMVFSNTMFCSLTD